LSQPAEARKRSFPRRGIAESANQDFPFAFSPKLDQRSHSALAECIRETPAPPANTECRRKAISATSQFPESRFEKL
jgi:hypothetical protein